MTERVPRPHVQRFANYVLAEESPVPLVKTTARCAVVDHYPPGAFKPAWHLGRVPYGRLLLYPEFLAFLTETRQRPDSLPTSVFSKEMVVPTLQNLREATRWMTVGSIVRDGYRLLSADARERLKKLIANPASTFVPLDTVASCEPKRVHLVAYLEVTTTDGRHLVFGSDAMPASGAAFWKTLYTQVGGAAWEPKIQKALADAAQRNTQT